MKSANWISATGRSPWSAIPIATPTMPDSARGVSITRRSPNSCRNPSVMRKTPPRTPTSSPRTTTRSSVAIASWRVSFTAVTRLTSAIVSLSEDVVAERTGVWIGSRPCLGDRGVELRLHLGAYPVDRRSVDHLLRSDVGLEQVEGVVMRLRLLDLLARAVAPVVVVGGVREEPVAGCLDQRRTLSGAGALHRTLHRGITREHIVAVDDLTGESVGLRPAGD